MLLKYRPKTWSSGMGLALTEKEIGDILTEAHEGSGNAICIATEDDKAFVEFYGSEDPQDNEVWEFDFYDLVKAADEVVGHVLGQAWKPVSPGKAWEIVQRALACGLRINPSC